MQCGNDCAVRERELPLPKGLYRNIVAQLRTHLFQVASFQVVDGDQLPVAVPWKNFDAIDPGSLAVSPSGYGSHVDARACQRSNCYQSQGNSFHLVSLSMRPFTWRDLGKVQRCI